MVKRIIITIFVITLLMPNFVVNAQANSSQFVQKDETTIAQKSFKIDGNYKEILRGEQLVVYIDESNFSLRILNVETGYIYSSNLDDYEQAGLNNVWQNYFESGVTIEYFDKNNLLKSTSITSSESTIITYTNEDNLLKANINFKSQKISFDVIISVEDDKLHVHLPYESIKDEDGILSSVVLFPGLGLAKAYEQDGYFMLADGIGALIRFDQVHKNLSVPYSSPYLGNDYGISDTTNNYNQRSTAANNFPFYGVVHGINTEGFVNWVESGAAHTKLEIYPAGIIGDLYFITNRFVYRNAYLQPISDTETVSAKMDEMFNYDAKETYQFTSAKANYVGLTNLYKQYLVTSKQIEPILNEKENIPMQIRFVGTTRTAGFLSLKNHIYSTYEGVSNAYDYFVQSGIDTMHITLDSFNESFTSNALNHVNGVGSNKSLSLLSEKVKDDNNQLDIAFNLNWLLKSKININQNARRMVTSKFAGFTTYFAGVRLDFFIPNLAYVQKVLSNAVKDKNISKYTGLYVSAFIDSDFNGKMHSREENTKVYEQFMSELVQDQSIQVDEVNFMNFGFADYTSFNINSNSQFPYFSDTVPIVSILTSGYTLNYSQPLNFSSDLNFEMLRAIEFNLLPNYKMMTQPVSTKILFEYESIGQIDNWKEQMVEQYNFINDALKYVYNAQITNYEVLQLGVNRVSYDNGYYIIVNYTDYDFVYNGQIVVANNYLVGKE